MRKRRLFTAAATLLIVLVLLWILVWQARRDTPKVVTMRASALSYETTPAGATNIVLAKTGFIIPPGTAMTQPHLALQIEAADGWQTREAGSMSPRDPPLNLLPGASNSITLALPANTEKWRLLVTGREGGLRLRLLNRLHASSGPWVRDSSFRLRRGWLWIAGRLPSTPGRPLEFRGEPLALGGNAPAD
jgi:hypothetical protein